MKNTLPEKRSPLKSPPPRYAGQSLQKMQDEFIDNNIMIWFFAATSGIISAGLMWAMLALGYSLLESAWILTVAAAINTGYAVYRFWKARHQLRAFKLGLDGERTVGALLDDLRRDGYRVLHDIPDAKKQTFNIDHALVGPGGVFAIETKTFSKVGTRDEKIRYENNELIIPGIGRDEHTADLLHQAKAAADFLCKHLTQTTGHNVHVQPVLVFPGWWVQEPNNPADRPALPVWVLNDKRIFDWIGKAPPKLSRENINLYTHRLRMHVDDCYDR